MSKITPIINTEKTNIIVDESNLLTLTANKSNDIIPYIDENDDIILQMSGPGPQGPIGPAGNGILKIEKTSTSDVVDTYTIYFTNGTTFSYEITNGKVYFYDGPYEVVPMPYTAQILPTANLAMSDNVNVKEIPYYETSNTSGGYTATIGDII